MSDSGEFFREAGIIVGEPAEEASMLPAPEICERARLARDPRFDGRFLTGVVTTGIYCRPICPARPAGRDNVRYFASAAAAEAEGYRACRRCRPEAAPRLPEWAISSDRVIRGLRLIEGGFLADRSTAALAARLGVSTRHLNRVFHKELGATPSSLARSRRLHLALRLIVETDLSFSDVALQAGYGSVRRFNAEMSATFGRSPRALRGVRDVEHAQELTLRLPVREPFDASWMFRFLERRALPGLEEVHGLEYRRRVGSGDHWISVSQGSGALMLKVSAGTRAPLASVMQRVRRLFDLDADPAVIDAHLARDARMAPLVAASPGLRVPGAWDGFETAVRAILGQQVSVERARRLAANLIQSCGEGGFPEPSALAGFDPGALGIPGKRWLAIAELSRAVADGAIGLDEAAAREELTDRLLARPGVGPWTAGYVGMRVAKDPDAFPDGDWAVLKALQETPARARHVAAPWRPWRAYAVMHLWSAAVPMGGAVRLQSAGGRRPTKNGEGTCTTHIRTAR
jgi:AraC family transcriptional regulator of adaptative response / DNA-3-methyladenine glycosylase II